MTEENWKIGFIYKEVPRRDIWISVGLGSRPSFEMPVAMLKTIMMFWLFCATAFFAYAVGKNDTNQTTLMTAYLAQGGIKTYDNKSMFCTPLMNQRGELRWECVNATTVKVNGKISID